MGAAEARAPAGRRDREERRAEVVAAARDLFLERGYEGVGMSDLVALGVASRPSIYRYFPGGPGDAFVAVANAVVAELCDRLRHAGEGPFSDVMRMEHLLAALFTYFTASPEAYRLLFRDVWTVRDEDAAALAATLRAPLVGEVAAIVAPAGEGRDHVLLASTGILGCALANLELVLTGAVDAEAAWRVTCAVAAALRTPS